MARVLSCIQPTGEVHLGNYLGALRNWVSGQHENDVFHGIVDLHALTVTETPGVLGEQTLSLAAMLFAVGLDPDVATVFVQSHLPQHSQLAWIMECTVSFGELSRMTQFKDKAAKREADFVSAGLFTYPALQAADILLYDANEVPVGDDQRQHIEITRDIAIRFNHRFGDTFVLPKAVTPKAGARVMDLQNPEGKMSKSSSSEAGIVYLLDEPSVIERKFKRAVTDSDSEVAYDRERKPGVANLLEILASASGTAPETIATKYSQYGPLKADAGAAVIAMLTPIRTRYHELINDRGELARLIRRGDERAEAVAAATLARAQHAIGMLPRYLHGTPVIALGSWRPPAPKLPSHRVSSSQRSDMCDVTFTAHKRHGLRITSGSREHARSDSHVLAVCTKRLRSRADHRGCHSPRSSKPSFKFADVV